MTQTTGDAIRFYNGKVDDLGKSLGELERVIGGKTDNMRIVEDGELAIPDPLSLRYHATLLTLSAESVATKDDSGRDDC